MVVATEAAGRVSAREWRWAVVLAAAIMLLTTVPVLMGLATGLNNPDWRFGGVVFNINDGYNYIAKMVQGAHGNRLFRLPYSPEPHPASPLFLPYLWLGALTGLIVGTADPLRLNAALLVTFHLWRVLAGAGVLLVSYRVLAIFVDEVWLRRLGLLWLAFDSGLNWLHPPIAPGVLPVAVYTPEAFSFLELFFLPHLSLARLCWLLALLAYLRGLRGTGLRAFALAGVLLLLSGIAQPIYLLTAYILLAGHAAAMFVLARAGPAADRDTWRRWWRRAWAGVPLTVLPSLPLFGAVGALFTFQPHYAIWAAQSPHHAGPWWAYLLSWGLLLLAGGFGVRAAWQRDRLLALWLGVWLVALPVLLYYPGGVERRLTEGLHVLLVGLALTGIARLPQPAHRLGALAGLMGLTMPFFLAMVGFSTVSAGQASASVFLPAWRVAAYAGLDAHLPQRSAVLSSQPFGVALPAYTPLVALLGVPPETVDFAAKRHAVAQFYDPATPMAERHALWQAWGQPVIVMGPDEAAAYGALDPDDFLAGFPVPLAVIYEADGVTVLAPP